MAAILPDTDSEDELPPGWEERATIDGNVYYVNHSTKGTQWTHPRTGKKKTVSGDLPYGWERVVSDDGKIVFVDHANEQTTYTDPRLAFAKEVKEHPHDFRQRFDGSSTALQVLHGQDLTGKIAVITGASSGIGYETARSLAFHGCKVILACRSLEKANNAVDKIKTEKSQATVDIMELNLESLSSVEKFSTAFKEKYQKLDILILNAGVFGLSFSLTPDGYETTFQVNHLSHFYLTQLLEPVLKKGSRVVIVSSESHRFSNITTERISRSTLSPSTSSQYWSMMAYNNSKLCNVLFATELARRWEGRGVCVYCLHPGNLVSSDLSRNWWFYRLLFAFVRPFTKSLQQAASTTVYCATVSELENVSGFYFNNCCRCEASKVSQSPELAHMLWNISAEMIQDALSKNVC